MSNQNSVKPELQKLVDQGVLSSEQALAAQIALIGVPEEKSDRTRRSLFSEAITYIGGAVIVVSAGLILNETWAQLGTWGRPGVIGLGAALLFAAAYLVSRDTHQEQVRRLSSTLFVGSAGLTAFTIGLITNELWIPRRDPNDIYFINPKPWVYMTIALLCALGGGLVAYFGYLRAKSAIGVFAQILAADVFVFAIGALIWNSIYGDDDFPSFGSLALVVLGSYWIYAAEKKVFQEVNVTAFASILTLFFALTSFRDLLPIWSVPAITIVGGFVYLALYLNSRLWPWLFGGIGGLLIGGVELLVRYVEGLGGALGSMLLGIVLLVIGTRLFRDKQ